MRKENNPSNNRAQDLEKTTKQCFKVASKLVNSKNPKSNLFAVCIIQNANGEVACWATAISDVVPFSDVICLSQGAIEEMQKNSNKTN